MDKAHAYGRRAAVAARHHHNNTTPARVAQSAERKTLNLVVVGSSPTSGDMELPMRSPRSRNGALRLYSLVAEHLTCNEKVRGSTPRGGLPTRPHETTPG